MFTKEGWINKKWKRHRKQFILDASLDLELACLFATPIFQFKYKFQTHFISYEWTLHVNLKQKLKQFEFQIFEWSNLKWLSYNLTG